MTSELQTYRIPEENLIYLQGKLEKLNKKAVKLGCEEIKLIIHSEENILNKATKTYQKYFNCTVSGNAPKLADWTFIAKLDHDYKTPLISTVPGITVPEHYHGHDSSCDHCKTNRYRRVTYVVQNSETKEYKHIGKSCLKDFLGHKDPKQILSWFEWFQKFMTEIESGEDRGFAVIERYDIHNVMEIAAMIIDEQGTYISNGKAQYDEDLTATTWDVSKYMWDIKSRKDFRDITDIDIQFVKDSIEYFSTLEVNDYIRNVNIILDEKFIKQKEIGLAVSIVGVYYNHLKKVEREEVEKQTKLDEHFGELKTRIDRKMKVLSSNYYDSAFGGWRVAMIDEDGRSFTWFASSDILEVDKEYILKMTIKDHNEYNGYKQTIVNRCKIVEEL